MVGQQQAGYKAGESMKDVCSAAEGEENEGQEANLLDERTPEQESCCQRLWRRMFPTGYCWELKGTMSIGWALMLTQGSQILFQPIAVMFAGHLGKLELDAVALANMLIAVLGNALVVGFATCLDTVFTQAFGNGNYKMIGDYLQKGLILHLLLLMPCCALYLNIKPILLALGQPPAVVELTSQYLLYFLPGFFFLFMWTALKKFTQCQNDVVPHIIIAFVGQGVHALLQYLFLYQFKFGVIGSSLAQGSSFGLICILTLIYTLRSKAYKLCWYGWSRGCLLDWGPLVALAIYGMLMRCLEWWAIAVSILLAGHLGETQLGAVNIPFHLNSIFFGLLRGLPKATCFRVGQFLGAANKRAAVCAARVGMTITAAGGAVCAVVYIAARNELPKIFTNDPDIIRLVSGPMPLLALFAFFDAIAVNGRGVFRGVGKQKWATVIIFCAYYLLALPIAVPLTLLTPLDIKGIWIGFSISSSVCSIIFFIVINFGFDWEKLEKEALERVSRKKAITHNHKDDESKYLLQGSVNQSDPDDTYIPKSLYIKRAVTVAFIILLPIVGLIIRLVTQTGTTAELRGAYNSTRTLMNTTESVTYIL